LSVIGSPQNKIFLLLEYKNTLWASPIAQLVKNPPAMQEMLVRHQEEKGTTEDEMAGWRYRLNGHESEQALGVGDGQGGLTCCGSWGHKELDTTE